jgi:hypothetical protein
MHVLRRLRCRTCLCDLGFTTTDEFEEWCQQFDHDSPPDDDGDDGPCGRCGCNECDCDNYELITGDELETEDIQRAFDDSY